MEIVTEEEKVNISESRNQLKLISKEWFEKYSDWLAFPTVPDGTSNGNLWCIYCKCFLRIKKDNVEKHYRTSKHIRYAKNRMGAKDVLTDDKGRVIIQNIPKKNKQGPKPSISQSTEIWREEDDWREEKEISRITIDENDPERLAHSIFSNISPASPTCPKSFINIPITMKPITMKPIPINIKEEPTTSLNPFPKFPKSCRTVEPMDLDDFDVFGKFIASELRTSIKLPELRSKLKRMIQMDVIKVLYEQDEIERKAEDKKRKCDIILSAKSPVKKGIQDELFMTFLESGSSNKDYDVEERRSKHRHHL